jgi:hypothetical protein
MKEELPPVEELVKRLRPEVLEMLDELFRAKWTDVKRVQQSDLKADYNFGVRLRQRLASGKNKTGCLAAAGRERTAGRARS